MLSYSRKNTTCVLHIQDGGSSGSVVLGHLMALHILYLLVLYYTQYINQVARILFWGINSHARMDIAARIH